MTDLGNSITILRLVNVNFSYKQSQPILKNLNLDIPQFRRVGLLGPNGSGKSTTFKIISTQLTHWQGDIFFAGEKLSSATEQKIRSSLGVCFQSPSLDPILTGQENLLLQARVLGLDKSKALLEISELAEMLKVTYLSERVGEISGGQARRVEIIKALLGNPKLLLLDEPTNGLDPQARRDFWQTLAEVSSRKRTSLIVTTHLIEEAEQCEELIFLSEGACVAQGTPKYLRESLGFDILQLEINDSAQKISEIQKMLDPGEKADRTDELIRISTPRGEKFFADLRARWKADITRIEWAKPTLADVYFEKTGKALH